MQNIQNEIKLIGHDNTVRSVTFHQEKPFLATGSDDETAKLWIFNRENITPKCVATLTGHDKSVNSVAFHPKELFLATGSSDHTVKLWNFLGDSSNPECVATLKGHTDAVNSVAFSHNGIFLATGSSDNTVKLWKFSLGSLIPECIATLKDHKKSVSSVAFHPKELFLATGSVDCTVKLWEFLSDGLTPSCTATLNAHSNEVSSVAFSHDGKFLATGSFDRTTKVWGISEINLIGNLECDNNHVTSVAFNPHPNFPLLATGGYNNVMLWQFLENKNKMTSFINEEILDYKENIVHSVAFSNNGMFFAIGCSGPTDNVIFIRVKVNNENKAGGGLQNESRFFKLVSINGKEVDGGRYELPAKTKSGKAQTRGPKDKASIAFSEICKKNNKKGECSYKFAIQETTRGSNKKVYHYEGKRVKLAKPIVLELKDKKTGKVKKVVKKYKNVIVAIH
jgi:WD40 repeat protein